MLTSNSMISVQGHEEPLQGSLLVTPDDNPDPSHVGYTLDKIRFSSSTYTVKGKGHLTLTPHTFLNVALEINGQNVGFQSTNPNDVTVRVAASGTPTPGTPGPQTLDYLRLHLATSGYVVDMEAE